MHACMCVCRVQLGRMDFQVTQVNEESRWVRSNFTRVYKGSSVTAHTHTHQNMFFTHLFLWLQGFQGKTGPPGPMGVVGPQVSSTIWISSVMKYFSCLVIHVCICVINPITYVLIRANQENLVQQGTAVTQGHQVYLESMVYLGLLGKKVERWVHTCQSHINTDHCHLIWAHVFIAECFSFFLGWSRFTRDIWEERSCRTERVQGEQRSYWNHGNTHMNIRTTYSPQITEFLNISDWT